MSMTQVATNNLSIIARRLELLDSLVAASSIAKSNSPQEALKCVRLVAKDGKLSATATDLVSRIHRVGSQIQVECEGAICMNAKDIADYIQLLDCETVKMEVDKAVLLVTGDSGSSSFGTISADDFPGDGTAEAPKATFTVSREGLMLALGFVSHAPCDTKEYYSLNGILIEGSKTGILNVVGTDGKLLAAVGIQAKISGSIEQNIIIPTKHFLTAIKGLPENDTDEIEIEVFDHAVKFISGDGWSMVQRLEGNYPIWRDFLNISGSVFADVARTDFVAALRRTTSKATEEDRGVALNIGARGIDMSLRSSKGKSSDSYPCRVNGGELVWGVHGPRLIAALSGMVDEDLKIEWAAPNRPAKFTCGEMTEVVMPVNLKA